MKKVGLLLLAMYAVILKAQDVPDSTKIENMIKDSALNSKLKVETEVIDDGVKIKVNTNEFVKVYENEDTTSITFGNKELQIVEDGNKSSVQILDKNKDKVKPPKFKGHWAGIELGLNNYLDNNFSVSRTPENEFMDLHTGKSWNFNINFAQYSFGIISDRFGLLTGLGLEYNNYAFNGDNTITEDHINDVIVNVDLPTVDKSKLKAIYLTMPVLMEVQIGGDKRSKRMHFSAGVIGGLKLGSKTKLIYYEDGVKNKEKNKDDYYLSPFRYGITARFGYQFINVYANYYASTLFQKDHGPQLYPFAVGFAITI